MKKLIFILTALSVLILSCSSDGDILARMEGHVITRGEFYLWLENRGIQVEDVMKNRKDAVVNLEQLAAEKLTAEKAAGDGFETDTYFRKLYDLVYRNYTVSIYREKIEANLEFTLTAADVSIISIDFKGNEKSKSFEDALQLIENKIFPELNSGTSFEDAALIFSKDDSASKKGSVGFIIPSMYGDNFAAEVLRLRINEFTTKPLVVGNSVLLVKVNRYADINENNIKSIITDANNLARIKNYMLESALRESEKKSISSHNVMSRIKDVSWSRPGDVIFTVDGEGFTVSDLDEILGIFSELKYGSRPFYRLTVNDKIIAAKRLLREILHYKQASAVGIESDPDFIKRWELVKRSILSGAYKYRKFSREIDITRNDIINEYKRLKESGVFRISGNSRAPVPFAEVENKLREEIFKASLLSLKNKWDSEILKDGGFIVYDKALSR